MKPLLLSLFAALVTVSLVSGCAVGPDYSPPEIQTPKAFSGPPQESVSAEDIAAWWTAFGDMGLSTIVEKVLENNLDLQAAVERVEFSRARHGIVRADQFPSVAATGSYQRTRPFGFSTQDQWTVGGTVAWEIDLFGRVRRGVEASIATFEADIEDLHSVRVSLVAETVATYLQLASLQQRYQIAQRNVAGQERSLEIANDRFDKGMAAGLDPAQAKVNLESTRASLPALELERQRALNRLSVLEGRGPYNTRDLMSVLAPPADEVLLPPVLPAQLPSVPEEFLVGIPADLLRNRPDIRSLERQLAAQTAQVGVAVASRYPSIQLSGTWDWIARNPGSLFESGTGAGGIGPLVSLPLFQGGRLVNAVRAEEALVRDLDLRLRQTVLVAQEEVENALFAIVRDRRRTELLEEATTAANTSVDLARQLYTSGQSDFQNVLDAQRSLFALEDELEIARLATLLDLVDLYRALGGGWGEPTNDGSADAP